MTQPALAGSRRCYGPGRSRCAHGYGASADCPQAAVYTTSSSPYCSTSFFRAAASSRSACITAGESRMSRNTKNHRPPTPAARESLQHGTDMSHHYHCHTLPTRISHQNTPVFHCQWLWADLRGGQELCTAGCETQQVQGMKRTRGEQSPQQFSAPHCGARCAAEGSGQTGEGCAWRTENRRDLSNKSVAAQAALAASAPFASLK